MITLGNIHKVLIVHTFAWVICYYVSFLFYTNYIKYIKMSIVIQLDDYVHREICFNLMSFTTFRLYNYFHISILE